MAVGSLALAAVAPAQTNRLNKMIGTIGDSELRGCLTRWYWSISGETPINDWNYDERRGYELGALMVYLSDGRLRSRSNTAWGGTTARDWANNGLLSGPGNSTPNTVNADPDRALRWKPSVVLICVGMNDATNVRGATTTPADHARYFAKMVKDVQATGAVPLVILAPPRDDPSAPFIRDLDGLTVANALTKMVALDQAYCDANKVAYLDTRSLLGRPSSRSSWIPNLRYDGVHFHAPSALKLLARALLAKPEIQALLTDPVVVAQSTPANGIEFGNLIQYACFQSGMDALGQRPVGWDLSSDSNDNSCKVAIKAATGAQLGNVLSLTRTRGSTFTKKIAQTITRGFSENGVLRFSGFFRASGFLDQFWHSPANGSGPDVRRCGYGLYASFLDARNVEIPNTRVSPCDNWAIDTEGDFWRFYQDFVVPPGTKSIVVQIQSYGDPSLTNQNAKIEIANLALRYLGPAGVGRVYP